MADRSATSTGTHSFRFFSPEQIDQILREGAKRGRTGSHAAIERIIKLEPGVERAELWQRIRQLKCPSHGTRYRRSVWSAKDDQILFRGYEGGWSGKQAAVRELLKRHPDWRAHVIWRRAAKLQLIRRISKRRLFVFLIVSDDPGSGAFYVYDRRARIWFWVDFDDEKFGGYTVSDFDRLVRECRFLDIVEHPKLLPSQERWVVQPGLRPQRSGEVAEAGMKKPA